MSEISTLLHGTERLWPSIAKDIAMLAAPASGATTYTAKDIAREYNLTTEQFTQLMQLPAFKSLLKQELDYVKELGPKAGARLRAEAMATEIGEYIFNRITQTQDLDDKLTVQFYGMLLKSAGLEQPPEMLAASAPQNTVNIAFNVPKLKNQKLAHIAKQSQVNVIDVEGTEV